MEEEEEEEEELGPVFSGGGRGGEGGEGGGGGGREKSVKVSVQSRRKDREKATPMPTNKQRGFSHPPTHPNHIRR